MQPNVVVKINALDQTKEAFNSLKRNLENTTVATERTVGSFGSLARGLAGVAAAYLSVQKVYSAAALGIQIAADLETAEVGLATLLGSTEKATETIARLKIEAARTPFELPGLTQATQLLTSVTKDGNKSIDIIMNIGEALAAMGKGQVELDRIIVNLQQIASVGRATTVDIKQFAFAGIPVYEMLAETTGKVGEELNAFIEEGGVTFEVLTQMFDKANDEGGRFFNAFVNQSGSFNQAAANMKDSFGLMMADIVKSSGLFDSITQGMIGASSVMANWRSIIDDARSNIASFFDQLDERTLLITHLKSALDTAIVTFRTMLKPAIDEFMLAIEPLKPFLESLVLVFGTMLVVALHAVVAAIQLVIAGVTLLLTGFTKLATFIAESLSFTINHLSAVIQGVAAVFRGDWAGAIDAVRLAIDNLIVFVDRLIDRFEDAIDLAKEIGGGSIDFVKGLLPGRATGGPVARNKPYIVGERGPELFVPGSSGSIIPNGALQPATAGMAPVYITITGNSFMGERDMAEKVGDQIIAALKRNQRL